MEVIKMAKITKYENWNLIQDSIMKLENYPSNSFMYANLCGRLFNYISDEDMNTIRVSLDYELEELENNSVEDLVYERAVGK
jgi:hypothetical protein